MFGTLATIVFAYGEYNVNDSTFKSDTDNNNEYLTWKSQIWDAGESANSSRIVLVPGSDESKLNFGWYSKGKGTPAIKIWKDGNKAQAKIVTGQAVNISAMNWQGETYAATNKVTVENLEKIQHIIINIPIIMKKTQPLLGQMSINMQHKIQAHFQPF